MDTRTRVCLLLDYSEYYGLSKTIEDAKNLIKDIPSESLINYISGINSNLYLRENDDDSTTLQIGLIKNIIEPLGESTEKKFIEVYQKQIQGGHTPIIFWNYTNLKFYDLIFQNFNALPCREMTPPEIQNFFDAYLILNDIANKKITIDKTDIDNALKDNALENVIITNFIYQKDYVSSLDYNNQVVRGVYFFKYLENDPKFGPAMNDYYATKNVSGYLEMFRNLMLLVAESGIHNAHRIQIVNLAAFINCGIATEQYLDTLCINNSIANYKPDDSFTNLRNEFLYKIDGQRYYLLNINFLYDHFYKSQVFAVSNFLRKEKITSDFLSIKGKDFTDKIYFPEIIKNCFPDYTNYFGDDCKNSHKEELCDGYVRDGNKLILIEFKDVLLNAKIKNTADEVALFREFHTKFVENQTGSPKGIRQLQAAIKDIESNGVIFDTELPNEKLTIYPIIVYTDLSFGADGLNKIYRKKFNDLIEPIQLTNFEVSELTFINLSFFEQRQDYFADGSDKIFELLENFHDHVKQENYELTSFEIFSKFYTREHYTLEVNQPKIYLKFQKEIVNSTPVSKRK